jgi:hypothetical protein
MCEAFDYLNRIEAAGDDGRFTSGVKKARWKRLQTSTLVSKSRSWAH